METPRYISNREIILDAIIFLGIVITAIYTIKKRKKDDNGEGQNYIECSNGTNEEKGLIIKEIQQNVKKYKDGKQFLSALLSIPALIICPIPLGFCLYGIITNEPDTRSPVFLMFFLIALLIYIFLLKNSKKTLDKYNNNLFFKIIKLYVVMFIALIIVVVLWVSISFISQIIYQKFNLNLGLSVVITILFVFILIALGIYFFTKYNGLSLKNSSKNHGDNEGMNKQ